MLFDKTLFEYSEKIKGYNLKFSKNIFNENSEVYYNTHVTNLLGLLRVQRQIEGENRRFKERYKSREAKNSAEYIRAKSDYDKRIIELKRINKKIRSLGIKVFGDYRGEYTIYSIKTGKQIPIENVGF